jgi:hypothetical protein
MRRQIVWLIFAGVLGLCASALAATGGSQEAREPDSTTPVAVQRVSVPPAGLRDEAAMVLVGTALIGLAAALKRAA